jgi:hypothetical protein
MFFISTALKPQYQDSHLKVNDRRWAYQSFLVKNLLQKIYNDMNNVSWPELCMINCSSFAVVTYTVCPTHYQTWHFFNNSNTNEDIAMKFEQEYVHCVRNEKECVCSVPNCCNTEQRSASQRRSVASGTPYSTHMYLLLSTTMFSFHTFHPISSTYTCIHTYIHPMDPKVCQNKTEMWNNS